MKDGGAVLGHPYTVPLMLFGALAACMIHICTCESNRPSCHQATRPLFSVVPNCDWRKVDSIHTSSSIRSHKEITTFHFFV